MTRVGPLMKDIVSERAIADFKRDGAVCLRGIFAEWVDVIAAGIERNLREPGPYAADSVASGEAGSFFDDYCNWRRIAEFRELIERSPVAEIAARIMGSQTAQFFHDHVLVKEPGTQKATPWHQDSPYYFVDGRDTVSFWIPIDPVREATLRLIAGSQHWNPMILPVRWLDDGDFYSAAGSYRPVPDPDTDPELRILEWALEPGDAVLFHFATAHGARGNPSLRRRRALSLRWVGDDAHYAERPGRTSPPFPGHGMQPGQRLRSDWFPVLYDARVTA
jgi:ectoine hydroxylase-related dioxygenase (phytanoyl-CoA dioxygenase family)